MTLDTSIPNSDPLQHDESLLNLLPINEKNPFLLFSNWFAEAKEIEKDSNAFSLATIGLDNIPNVRVLLLKEYDEKGFVFFTHYDSNKGKEIESNPKAAMCFHWKSLLRQIRIRGIIEKISPEKSDEYFQTRPRDSQIGVLMSKQSRSVKSREVMMQYQNEITEKYSDKDIIPRPDYWGGYRLIPTELEFWRNGAFRLHDRYVFHRDHIDSPWVIKTLYP